MIFRTKVDAWVLAVLILGFAAPIVAAIAVDDRLAFWYSMLVEVIVVALFFLVAIPCTYEIQKETLVVRSGAIRWRIALEDIVGISETRSPISGPAWSTDRVRVEYNTAGRDRSILISPNRKQEFIEELTRRAPGLRGDTEADRQSE